MNEKEFLKEYIPLMGKAVKDNLFNTKRLTKTAILNKFVEIFITEKMAEAYEKENLTEIVKLSEKVIQISFKLGFEIKKEWLKFNLLPHSIANSKIGNDTLCISVNSGMLCFMGICGRCSNCKICYARNSNRMYSNEFLKNTISQIVILKIMLGILTIHEVLMNTIYSIVCEYSQPQIKELAFLRWNVNGDILNNEMLIIVNEFSKGLKTVFNLLTAYSYSHNEKLNFELATDIVFNTSDFISQTNKKQCRTIFNFDISLLGSEKVILCNGNCHYCPYCKFEFETRTVLFLAHGGQFEGLEAIDDRIISYLEYNKFNDYLLNIRVINGV